MNDALLTLAEFSIALAGFTGVVVVFGSRPGGWHPMDRYRVSIILWCSIGPAFLSLLPIGFGMFGLQGSALWRLCSLLFVLWGVGAARAAFLYFRQLDADSRSLQSDFMFWFNRSGIALALVVQALNSLGIWFGPGPGPYFLGLVFILFIASYVFARMVLVRPGE